MGGGASRLASDVVANEAKKPRDASDVSTPRSMSISTSAIEEVKRLRKLLGEVYDDDKVKEMLGLEKTADMKAAAAEHAGAAGAPEAATEATAEAATEATTDSAESAEAAETAEAPKAVEADTAEARAVALAKAAEAALGDDDSATPLKVRQARERAAVQWGRHEDEALASTLETYQLQDHLEMQFPMYVLPIKTLLGQEKMTSFEDLQAAGQLEQWDESKGSVFFISHQWTAFNEPDHSRKQLNTLQSIFRKVIGGTFKECFGTPHEYKHFHDKDASSMNIFEPITPEELRAEVENGYIWLDYSCVPQAAEAQPERLRAIESIPHYIDASTTFLALCPKIKHKELDHFCDYHSWRRRGWCRLEEQVNELKLFLTTDRDLPQFGPGVKAWEVPRRPLMIMSDSHVTCVDMFDHFYFLGQRRYTVMNGDFACCSLNHEKVYPDGTVLKLPCDKDRIRPFCMQMWQRKSNHFQAHGPMVRHMFAWRYISHMYLMMARSDEDSPENNDDPELETAEDIVTKYFCRDPAYKPLMMMMAHYPMGMIQQGIEKVGDHGQFGGKETTPATDDAPAVLSLEESKVDIKKRGDNLVAALQSGEGTDSIASHLLAYMISEGNLKMCELLVKEHGADPKLGMPWSMCTGIDMAAGKGHLRVLKFLLDNGAMQDLEHTSHMNCIGVVDRAAKAGFVDVLDLLIDRGAKVKGVRRRNGETPAHGAAMHGHIDMLKRLKELGVDLNAQSYACKDHGGIMQEPKTPLDFAKYYYQTEACEYLESQGCTTTKWSDGKPWMQDQAVQE